MIYESRPNVTIEAASLSIKSGNAAILRGGSEAIDSNRALALLVQQALTDAGLPLEAVQLVPTTDRAAVGHLIAMPQYVDVIIPRGGKGLIERISAEAKVPVIKHLDGNCHTYVDDPCDIDMAVRVADNAKTQKVQAPATPPRACWWRAAWPRPSCPASARCMRPKGSRCAAAPRAWPCWLAWLAPAWPLPPSRTGAEEYLAPVISIKVVDGLDEAIAHINRHGSHHTESILTTHHVHAQRFLREVDSSSVMVNASTRFADGFEYGLGAEIGISTDKFHARGPVGVEGLTSAEVRGAGRRRNPYLSCPARAASRTCKHGLWPHVAPIMVPHLVTALTGPINELEQRILESTPVIERWFRLEWMEHTPPFYSSVDVRNAGFKLAPVDTNLFPAAGTTSRRR